MPPPFVTTFGTRWCSKVPARPVCTSGRGVFFFSRRPPECEVNGFSFETITNQSVIKIMDTTRGLFDENHRETDVEKVAYLI